MTAAITAMTPKPSTIARTTHGQGFEILDSICFTGSARRKVLFQAAVSTRNVGAFSSADEYLVCPREARGMSERLSTYPRMGGFAEFRGGQQGTPHSG